MAQQLLVHACREGDRASFERLVRVDNADPFLWFGAGTTLFHLAAKLGRLSILAFYLDPDQKSCKRLHVNAAESPRLGRRTALHHAVDYGHTHAVEMLLQHGADPNIVEGNFNFSCLHIALRKPDIIMAKLLISRSPCNLHQRDSFGNNAFYWAHEYGVLDQLRAVLAPKLRAQCDERSPSIEEKYIALFKSRYKRGLPAANLKISHRLLRGNKKGKKAKKGKKGKAGKR